MAMKLDVNKKSNKIQNFVVWLDGYLDAVGADQFNISKTNIIRNKLDSLFEHVAEETKEELTTTILPSNYDLPQNPEGPMVYRC